MQLRHRLRISPADATLAKTSGSQWGAVHCQQHVLGGVLAEDVCTEKTRKTKNEKQKRFVRSG